MVNTAYGLTVYITDDTVSLFPGQNQTRMFYFNTGNETSVDLITSGNGSSFSDLNVKKLSVEKNQDLRFNYTITIPKDTTPGNYGVVAAVRQSQNLAYAMGDNIPIQVKPIIETIQTEQKSIVSISKDTHIVKIKVDKLPKEIQLHEKQKIDFTEHIKKEKDEITVTLDDSPTVIKNNIGEVTLPRDLIISSKKWDGVLLVPTVTTTSDPPKIETTQKKIMAGKTIQVGSVNEDMEFNKPVRLVLFGEGIDKNIVYVVRNGISSDMSKCVFSDSQANAEQYSFDHCYLKKSGDVIIWTTHFTVFGVYQILDVVQPVTESNPSSTSKTTPSGNSEIRPKSGGGGKTGQTFATHPSPVRPNNVTSASEIIKSTPIVTPEPEISNSLLAENVPQSKTKSYLAPPLKQVSTGISPQNVECNDGFGLILKSSDGSPACVKLSSIEKLVQRGWATKIV